MRTLDNLYKRATEDSEATEIKKQNISSVFSVLSVAKSGSGLDFRLLSMGLVARPSWPCPRAGSPCHGTQSTIL